MSDKALSRASAPTNPPVLCEDFGFRQVHKLHQDGVKTDWTSQMLLFMLPIGEGCEVSIGVLETRC